jgi:hypothetical protein
MSISFHRSLLNISIHSIVRDPLFYYIDFIIVVVPIQIICLQVIFRLSSLSFKLVCFDLVFFYLS